MDSSVYSLCFRFHLTGQAHDYHFGRDGISREVLENYLDRSITYSCLLVPSRQQGPACGEFVVRMKRTTYTGPMPGAKHVPTGTTRKK